MNDSAAPAPAPPASPEPPAPAPEPSPRRFSPRRRRRLAATISVTALLLLGGGYTAVCALAPLPQPSIELEPGFAEPQRFAPDPDAVQAVVDAQMRPTAIGWAHDSTSWTNDDRAYPLASLTKLVTALVVLDAQPYDAEALAFTWGEAEEAIQSGYLANNGIVYPTPFGTEVTQREALTLMLLPSANDYAAAFAHAAFGDNDGFVVAVEAWAQRHGFESLRIVEPSGMDAGNVANAADLLSVARLALAEPVLADIMRLTEAEIPWGAGLVENTNPLIRSLPDIVGAKTGTLDAVGYNYIVAQRETATGASDAVAGAAEGVSADLPPSPRELVKVSVTLARPSAEARAQSGRDMLGALGEMPEPAVAIATEETIGTAVTVDGRRIPLLSGAASSAMLVPGEAAERSVEIGGIEPGAAGREIGAVRIEWPEGVEPEGDASADASALSEVSVVTAEAFEEPSFWWRLTHPADLLG